MNKKKLRKLIEKKFAERMLCSIWADTHMENSSRDLILTVKEWREILIALGAKGELLDFPDYCRDTKAKTFIEMNKHGDLEPHFVPFNFGQHAKIVLTKVIDGKVYYLRSNQGVMELVRAGKEGWIKEENLPGYYVMEIYDIPVVKE